MLSIPLNYLTRKSDLEKLISLGISHFYIGYMPSFWYQKYGWELSTNRRFFPVLPHITAETHLREIISTAHKHNARIFLALNYHYYSWKQYPFLRKIIKLSEELEIDGYIVSDLALILYLRREKINREIHLSTCAGCYNTQTISFYEQFGIKHFNLPRKLSPGEITELLNTTPSYITFEILIFGEWCKYSDAYCFTAHGYNRENFCNSFFIKKLVSKQKGAIPEEKLPSTAIPHCGVCIISKLHPYNNRIIYKLSLRSSDYPGIDKTTLVRKILKILKSGDISAQKCQKIMDKYCHKKHACAYEI